jgi:hypothetical protein
MNTRTSGIICTQNPEFSHGIVKSLSGIPWGKSIGNWAPWGLEVRLPCQTRLSLEILQRSHLMKMPIIREFEIRRTWEMKARGEKRRSSWHASLIELSRAEASEHLKLSAMSKMWLPLSVAHSMPWWVIEKEKKRRDIIKVEESFPRSAPICAQTTPS